MLTFQHIPCHPIKSIHLIWDFLVILKSYHYQSLPCTHFCKYVFTAYPILKYPHGNGKKINHFSFKQTGGWLNCLALIQMLCYSNQPKTLCVCVFVCTCMSVIQYHYIFRFFFFFFWWGVYTSRKCSGFICGLNENHY